MITYYSYSLPLTAQYSKRIDIDLVKHYKTRNEKEMDVEKEEEEDKEEYIISDPKTCNTTNISSTKYETNNELLTKDIMYNKSYY
jgi:hypothetical protein